MNSIYSFDGKSDMGYQRTVNEDYIDAIVLDDKSLFLVVADGIGSVPGGLQPAAIAVGEISHIIRRFYQQHKEILFSIPEIIMREAMYTANRVLNVFPACDEERFAGFGTSATCCFIYQINGSTRITAASTGNTRLYLLRLRKDRVPSIHQLSADHTKAAEMLDEGIIGAEQYYTHPDRIILTSGLGVVAEPKIQIINDIQLKKNDIILLTSDGIHYAIRTEAISDIVLQSGSCADATKGLIEAAKLEKYPDNMSAVITYLP